MGLLALLAIALLAWLAIQATRASRDAADDDSRWTSTRGSANGRTDGEERAKRPHAVVVAPTIPPLPEIAVTIKPAPPGPPVTVSDVRMSGVETHTCDLEHVTCTCESFSVFRAGLAPDNVLRLCRHLRGLLGEAGLIEVAEPHAEILWYERGGRLFRWDSPDGKVLYFSVDPTRDWINVDVVRRRRTADSPTFGWSVSEQRWSYGKSPRGYARAVIPALAQLTRARAAMRRELPADIEQQWDHNREAYRERLQREADAIEAEQRAIGLRCRICDTPFGKPWGTPIGSELHCATCGFTSLVTKERATDVDELAVIDWKYYDDPRPGGARGPISLAKEEQERALDALRARVESGAISIERFEAERSRIETDSAARISGLYGERAAELEEPLHRVRNATARFKRLARREAAKQAKADSATTA